MKIRYDREVDAAYIRFCSQRPSEASESMQGVILYFTDKKQLVGIEILNASERFPIRNLHTLQFVS